MKTLKPWLVILLVFAAGFAGGVVATRATVRHFVRQAVANPDHVRGLIEKRMVVRLGLDAEQHRKVRQILVERQGDLRQLRMEFAPRFLEIVTNAETQISAMLSPEQRETFEKLREENRHLWPRPMKME